MHTMQGESTMMSNLGTVLILGANGRFGRVARQAFAAAGWTVVAQTRRALLDAGAARHVAIDAGKPAAIVEATGVAQVVVNALNPVYTQWEEQALELNEAALSVARGLGATLMLPGNVYNYGRSMPPLVTEATPERPSTRKGEIRCRMEARMRASGQRTIVVRAGDFFGGPGMGSWMDQVIVKDIRHGRITYPGPLDRAHAWAYLPDLASSFVRLALVRDDLPEHASFLFPGHTLTGAQFVAAITEAARRLGVPGDSARIRVRSLPWGAIALARVFSPMMREIWHMRYLWQVPHGLSGDALERVIGAVPSTPLDAAVTASLRTLFAERAR
jgi:nucleoside-diphosphate-sugar epimerase